MPNRIDSDPVGPWAHALGLWDTWIAACRIAIVICGVAGAFLTIIVIAIIFDSGWEPGALDMLAIGATSLIVTRLCFRALGTIRDHRQKAAAALCNAIRRQASVLRNSRSRWSRPWRRSRGHFRGRPRLRTKPRRYRPRPWRRSRSVRRRDRDPRRLVYRRPNCRHQGTATALQNGWPAVWTDDATAIVAVTLLGAVVCWAATKGIRHFRRRRAEAFVARLAGVRRAIIDRATWIAEGAGRFRSRPGPSGGDQAGR